MADLLTTGQQLTSLAASLGCFPARARDRLPWRTRPSLPSSSGRAPCSNSIRPWAAHRSPRRRYPRLDRPDRALGNWPTGWIPGPAVADRPGPAAAAR